MSYNHQTVEPKWQQFWRDQKSFQVANQVEGKENFYLLVEFPYPSGNLHVGHWYAFCVPDIVARFKRMQGYNVLYPMGFDAFGLPAENAAIKRGLDPEKWTYENMDYMRQQIGAMGASFDTSREVVTCDPKYYRWTQWLFLELFKAGLVTQRDTHVNWCPDCKTVLANEQVVDGHCERCDNEVTKKNMKQWNVAITQYADRLIDDLDSLGWPDQIKTSQKNWIGRSEGSEVDFQIGNETVSVFTTRPDTLFGVTYFVLSPEHPLVDQISTDEHRESVVAYRQSVAAKSDLERTELNKDKTGVFTGAYAINPVNGESIPVWIADYVLITYGTGAVMAVPAHDERDHEFAHKYDLEIRAVIQNLENPFAKEGGEICNSDFLDGLDVKAGVEAAIDWLESNDKGRRKRNYKLRDWTVSRQRFWGVPIPIIHCPSCGPVPDPNLPVELPKIDDYLPREDGRSPLAKATDWLHTACPQCGEMGERETDTLDTFVCSSWYFLRYCDPQNDQAFADREKLDAWMPVDLYSGGSEHTTMHVLYSRFWHKALHDLDLVPGVEPYTHRMNRGLIMGPDGNKMSKSKGNVIDPDAVVKELGSDTVRMYLAFIGPYNEVGSYPWSTQGIVGVRRFIDRVWRLREKVAATGDDVAVPLHKAIKKITEDTASLKLNTCVAELMTLGKIFEKTTAIAQSDFEIFLQLLAPYAPHLAEEIWAEFGHKDSITQSAWPVYDESCMVADTVTYAIQVNGKVRGQLEVAADADKDTVLAAAREVENVAKWLSDGEIRKEIFVPGKIAGFVVS